MDTLIINGINWLECIGLKCIFWDEDREYEGRLLEIDPSDERHIFMDDNESTWWGHCRLAQGDKTPYDGKGQPVPDGVEVKVWFEDADWPESGIAKGFPWAIHDEMPVIEFYQVQEQKG